MSIRRSVSLDDLAREVGDGLPLLRRKMGPNNKKWSQNLSFLCGKVDDMLERFMLGDSINRPLVERAKGRLDKIEELIPKSWFFRSQEERQIEKAQRTLSALLDPGAYERRNHIKTDRASQPSLDIPRLDSPWKVFLYAVPTLSNICKWWLVDQPAAVRDLPKATPTSPETTQQTDASTSTCAATHLNESLPLTRINPNVCSQEASSRVNAILDQIPVKKSPQTALLKQQALKLKRELAKTMRTVPSDQCPAKEKEDWLSAFRDQCHRIELLERDLKQAMQAVRPALQAVEDLGHGNKHINLVKMHTVVDALDISDLVIPMPHGISTDEVHAFLQREAPEVFENWEALRKLKMNWNPSDGPFLDMPAPAAHLRAIHEAIDLAFSKEGAYESLNPSPQLREWLAKQASSGNSLMVRSTGAEDSHQTANAGGNVSKAYVSPEPKPFCQALGAVAKSYFGETSLKNRMNAGIDPFEEPLKLAVTAQELIGEPVGGTQDISQVPVSFVLFTNEPLYIGQEKFRAMRISATYGHGEAVVSSQGIPTDTALILQSEVNPDQLYILYDKQLKPERLAPIQVGDKVVLSKVENPVSIQAKRALSVEQLTSLYRSGVLMESFFDDHPTDIEGIVKGDQVYFVQARPVNRKPLLPTYLDLGGNAPKSKIQAEMLVSGKASVVTIQKKEEVLFAPTLEEAERQYRRDIHKLVIVTEPEPENSHPVVNFSGLGVPCLYAADGQAVQTLLGQIDGQHSVAACMQTAAIYLWDQSTSPLENHVKEGFAVHPAKIAHSHSAPTFKTIQADTPKEIRDLLIAIRSAPTKQQALSALDQLEALPQIQGLGARIEALEQSADHPAAAGRIEALKSLQKSISRAIGETRSRLKSRKDHRLEPLLHLKVLETLIDGANHPTRLGNYSLRDADSLCAGVEAIANYQKDLTHPGHCLDLVLEAQGMNQEASDSWIQLLKDFEDRIQRGDITQEQMKDFKEMVGILRETGAMPMWLTFFTAKGDQTVPKLLEQAASVSDQANLRSMQKEQRGLDQIRSQLARFASPDTFPQAREELLKIIERLSSQEWMSQVKSGSPITKVSAYQTMAKAVDLLDTAIKTMKSSQQFSSDAEKVKLFKEMLQPYRLLMTRWVTELVPSETFQFVEGTLNSYLSEIERILQDLPDTDPNQLLPSQVFSVSAAMLGSMAAFSRHYPERLEDVLTLLHQNCLASINALNQELLTPEEISASRLPGSLIAAMNKIENTDWGRSIQRIGLEVTEREIVFRYNVPLRNHSGHVDLHYDRASGKITLKGQLLGQARRRWGETAAWVGALQSGVFLSAEPILQTEQELKFSWILNADNLESAMREYMLMAQYSLGNGNFNEVMSRLYIRYKNHTAIEDMVNYFVDHPTWEAYPFYTHFLYRQNINEQEFDRILVAITHAGDSTSVMWSTYLKKATTGQDAGAINAFIDEFFGNQKHVSAFKRLTQSPQLATRDQQVAMTLRTMKLFDSNGLFREAKDLFSHLLTLRLGIPSLIEFAEEIVKTNFWRGLKLLEELVNSGHGMAEAEKVAISLNNRNLLDDEFFSLITSLVKKNYAINLATQNVKKWLPSTPKVDHLCETLIAGGHTNQELVQIIEEMTDSPDQIKRRKAVKYLEKVIRSGHPFRIDLATQLANRGIDSDEEYGISLFDALIERGHAIENCLEKANALLNLYFRDQGYGLRLLQILAKKGYALDRALEAANKFAFSEDSYVKIEALKLFQFFVEKNQHLDEALKIAELLTSILDKDDFGFRVITPGVLELFKSLVRKGRGIEEAKEALKMAEKRLSEVSLLGVYFLRGQIEDFRKFLTESGHNIN